MIADVLKISKSKLIYDAWNVNGISVEIIDDNNFYIEKCVNDTVYNYINKILNNKKGRLLKYVY